MIVAGQDKRVAIWAAARLGQTFVPPFVALGIERNGELAGAAIFNDFACRNIEMTAVGKGVWTRGVCEEICWYCFKQLGCRRITVRTKATNFKLRRLFERYGAKHEGTLRDWYDDDDCAVYGLLKADCRFLR